MADDAADQPWITQRSRPEQIGIIGSIVGVVLLVAPFAPPQAAIFGFVAICAIGLTSYWGVQIIGSILANATAFGRDRDRDRERDAEQPQTPHQRAKQQYMDGALTDEEFEREIERIVAAETDTDKDHEQEDYQS